MNEDSSTKSLARKLGLLKRRSSTLPILSSNSGKTRTKLKKSDQIFSYLIVLDFESTCWKDKNNSFSPEIIEFPAVLLNTSNGEIQDKFHHYVQPSEHAKLSQFCKDLTGISQEKVDSGIPIGTCLNLFDEWVKACTKKQNIALPSKRVDQQVNCIFATWSDWDLNVCLNYECKRKRLNCFPYLKSWIDLRNTYRHFYGRNPKGLNGALTDLGIEFVGREHSGIDDAINTAKLAWRMVKDGCIMKATKSLLLDINAINGDNEKQLERGGTDGKSKPPDECKTLKNVSNNTPVSTNRNLKCIDRFKQNLGNGKTPSPGYGAPITTINSCSVTPPLCECGKRCKRKRVINPGPNIDRIFYACSMHTYGSDKKDGCNFFKWENNSRDSKSAKAMTVLPKVSNSFKDRTKLKEHYAKMFNK